jgi:glycosyltransferase involved in cell wall biosynthesis
MTRLVHVTTVPDSLIFLRGQVGYMKGLGYDVSVVSSPGEGLELFGEEEGVRTFGLPMPRRITPGEDLKTVARMTRLFRELRPDIVHAHTPKGGLLGMMAAAAARVPVRIYQMRGLPMMTAKGWRRRLLKATERTACALAHRVICQSHSMREVALAEGLVSEARSQVILGGSNGVDAAHRFNPNRFDAKARREIRTELGLDQDAIVVGFVGRLVRDKGICELADAWTALADVPGIQLLLVGPFEPQDPVPTEVRQRLERDPRARLVGFTSDPPRMYAAMDVVTLPTYREGFPNVPLEAAAMGLPVVATEVPGCTDAIVAGETGTLATARDAQALEAALRTYLGDASLRRRHGEAGRARALSKFQPERLWEATQQLYLRETNPQGASVSLVRGALE